MQLATAQGLDRFDPASDSFTVYRQQPESHVQLGSDVIGQIVEDDRGMLWIGIDKGKDGPVYSYGEDDKGPAPEDAKLDEDQVLNRLQARLKDLQEPVEVRVTAHRDLSYETVKKLTVALEPYRQKRKISAIRAEVTEKQQ